MSDEMGTFRTDIELENPARPGVRRQVSSVLVDTGAELSWIPAEVLESLGITRFKLWRFRQADGTALERWAGAALVYAGGTVTSDEVVFGQPGDMILLGARSLEGLNLLVDAHRKMLVDAGPAPAGVAAPRKEQVLPFASLKGRRYAQDDNTAALRTTNLRAQGAGSVRAGSHHRARVAP